MLLWDRQVGALSGPAIDLALAVPFLLVLRLALSLRENVRLLERSRDEALTDSLTGLGNRRALMRALSEALEEAAGGRPWRLALFDLDGFKAYNDVFGHVAGDVLIEHLGGRLAGSVQGVGRAFRMGGDEFCVLVPAERATAALVRAGEALREEGEGFRDRRVGRRRRAARATRRTPRRRCSSPTAACTPRRRAARTPRRARAATCCCA